VGKNRGDEDVASSTLAGTRSVLIYSCNRCSLCLFQCGSGIAATSSRSDMEQRLVSSVGFRRHQLYEELGICRFCSIGLLDGSVRFHDTAQAANSGRVGKTLTFLVRPFGHFDGLFVDPGYRDRLGEADRGKEQPWQRILDHVLPLGFESGGSHRLWKGGRIGDSGRWGPVPGSRHAGKSLRGGAEPTVRCD